MVFVCVRMCVYIYIYGGIYIYIYIYIYGGIFSHFKKKKKEALPFAIAWVYLKGIHFAK